MSQTKHWYGYWLWQELSIWLLRWLRSILCTHTHTHTLKFDTEVIVCMQIFAWCLCVGLLEVMRTYHNIDEASLHTLQLQVGKERWLTSTHIILVLRLCVPPGKKQSGPPRQIRLMDQWDCEVILPWQELNFFILRMLLSKWRAHSESRYEAAGLLNSL